MGLICSYPQLQSKHKSLLEMGGKGKGKGVGRRRAVQWHGAANICAVQKAVVTVPWAMEGGRRGTMLAMCFSDTGCGVPQRGVLKDLKPPNSAGMAVSATPPPREIGHIP